MTRYRVEKTLDHSYRSMDNDTAFHMQFSFFHTMKRSLTSSTDCIAIVWSNQKIKKVPESCCNRAGNKGKDRGTDDRRSTNDGSEREQGRSESSLSKVSRWGAPALTVRLTLVALQFSEDSPSFAQRIAPHRTASRVYKPLPITTLTPCSILPRSFPSSILPRFHPAAKISHNVGRGGAEQDLCKDMFKE